MVSDGGLLSGIAAGDEACFEVLYHRHSTTCRQRARRVLACDDGVQDVVQAVFLDVWLHAGRFDEALGSARGWLLRLTHHKAVDLVRVQQRHAARCVREDLLATCADPARAPDQLTADAETAQQLRVQVAGLSAVQREAVWLYFLCGLSQNEAAARLGVPVATLKTRMHRGIVELRKRLDDAMLQGA
jgi:RNA polymerase sigma-70 factor (ECF subfamily)